MDTETKDLLHKVLAAIEAVDVRVTTAKAELSAEIKAVSEELSAQIDAVDAKVDEIAKVAGANHFRSVGRIEQLTAIVTDHISDGEIHLPKARSRA